MRAIAKCDISQDKRTIRMSGKWTDTVSDAFKATVTSKNIFEALPDCAVDGDEDEVSKLAQDVKVVPGVDLMMVGLELLFLGG